MNYVFQVGKKVQQDCVLRKVRIGKPVDVEADCLEDARQEAASKIIVRSSSYKVDWNNPAGSYDMWLRAEAQGRHTGSSAFFWYYDEQKVLN